MPLPVIPFTYRVVFNWNHVAGVKPVNVIHVRATDLAAHTASAVGAGVWGAFQDHQFTVLSSSQQMSSITVLPLDGVSASAVVTGGPNSGEGSGDICPAISGIVSLRTGLRGSRGRGRIYLGPTTEGKQNGGFISDSDAAALTFAWNHFQSALNGGSPPLELVIASYKHADANAVVSANGETACATQRRRQGQLR